MIRVGQNRIYTPYMTVYMVNSLPKRPYTHRIYIWFWPTLGMIKNTGATFNFFLWCEPRKSDPME